MVELRRAKFVAVSLLTDDFLDTSAVLTSFEGELEGDADMISLMNDNSLFGWSPGEEVSSTFHPPVSDESMFPSMGDWSSRFHQYEERFGDRSEFSLACVVDGICPVNFKDQTRGQHSKSTTFGRTSEGHSEFVPLMRPQSEFSSFDVQIP